MCEQQTKLPDLAILILLCVCDCVTVVNDSEDGSSSSSSRSSVCFGTSDSSSFISAAAAARLFAAVFATLCHFLIDAALFCVVCLEMMVMVVVVRGFVCSLKGKTKEEKKRFLFASLADEGSQLLKTAEEDCHFVSPVVGEEVAEKRERRRCAKPRR